MTAQEVAEYLGVHVSTVRRYYLELGGIKLGRIYRFSEDKLFSREVSVQPVETLFPDKLTDPHGLLT